MCTDMYQPHQWLQGGKSAFVAHCRPGTKLLQALRIHWVTLALSCSICLGNRIQDSCMYPENTMKWTRNKISYSNLWSKRQVARFTDITKGFSFQATMKLSEVICKPPRLFRQGSAAVFQLSPVTRYQLGFMLVLWEQMGTITGDKEENLRFLHQNHEVVWKKIEENFVPFPINANLCNITQMVLFSKDSQQSIHFKYFNTVKKKKKKQKHGRQSFAILNTNTQPTKDLLCVCCYMCPKCT